MNLPTVGAPTIAARRVVVMLSVDYTEILIALITLFVAPATGVVTWRLTKRKQVAEAESTIVAGANQAVDAMVLVMAELRSQLLMLNNQAEALRAENLMLREQVDALRKEIDALKNTKEKVDYVE